MVNEEDMKFHLFRLDTINKKLLLSHQARPPLRDEKRLSGRPKGRKLVKANEDVDGDWKEF